MVVFLGTVAPTSASPAASGETRFSARGHLPERRCGGQGGRENERGDRAMVGLHAERIQSAGTIECPTPHHFIESIVGLM